MTERERILSCLSPSEIEIARRLGIQLPAGRIEQDEQRRKREFDALQSQMEAFRDGPRRKSQAWRAKR